MDNKIILVAVFLMLAVITQLLIGPLCDTLPDTLSIDIDTVPRNGILKLYYATGKELSENSTVRMQVQKANMPAKVIFKLPSGMQFTDLMLSFRGQQGRIAISGMDLGYYHWGPADIKGSFLMSSDINSVNIGKRCININAVGPNAHFSSIGSFEYVYSHLMVRAAVIRAVMFLIVLLAFFTLLVLLERKGQIAGKTALNIIKYSVFYCMCILLLVPAFFTILDTLNPVKMPVFSTSTFNTDTPDRAQICEKGAVNFLKNVHGYYGSNYAFHDLFIRWLCTLSVGVLNESPLANVIAGKDGWLFYNGDGSLDDHLGVKRLNQHELADLKRQWTDIKNYLDRKGIYLLVVFVPDKESVYPEYMPDRFKPFAKSTRMEQVIAEIKNIPGLQYIDLRSTLIDAKGQYQLYDKVNSHWNKLGAFKGYQAITQRLATRFNQVFMPEIDEVNTSKYLHWTGDLSLMLVMEGEFSDNHVKVKESKENRNKIYSPSLLVFHDSVYNGIEPYFNHYFHDVLSAGNWQRFNQSIIERCQPDAVVFLMVERGSGSNLLPIVSQ